jgi:hypothetical protein
MMKRRAVLSAILVCVFYQRCSLHKLYSVLLESDDLHILTHMHSVLAGSVGVIDCGRSLFTHDVPCTV